MAEIAANEQEQTNLVPGGSKFADFGLSALTLRGLKEQNFITPTAVQLLAIPTALAGRDVVCAARTGSGKTLAFLIPLLEQLYAANWSAGFGLGALVMSPTRELAYQTYEVLRKIGKYHNFSAALVIGGSLAAREQEKKCLYKINIVVGTPGRLLDHFSANPQFDAANLKLLVLDEADRILDLGFQEAVDAILDYLPKRKEACQKILFSATQSRRIEHLVRRLNLSDPVFVSTDEESPYATPDRLKQIYCVSEPENKLDFIYSFVSHHRHAKILVFMQACKEVRYFYQALCHLRPGLSVFALYGHMGQMKRVDMYEQFHRKKHACLLATDVAARGLDFPAVDWVVQLDAPENENEYIHRVGRTARLNRSGQSLLVLTSREEEQEKFVERLQSRRIPIEKMEISPKFLRHTRIKLQAYCAAMPAIKLSAQACLRAYLRSLWLLKKREEVLNLDLSSLAQSYGLLSAPRLRFIERARQRQTDAADNSESPAENSGSVECDVEIMDDDETVNIRKKIKTTVDAAECSNASVATSPPKHKPLNVDEARERLQAADRVDKQKFRMRIKRQHDDMRHSVKAGRKQELEERSGF